MFSFHVASFLGFRLGYVADLNVRQNQLVGLNDREKERNKRLIELVEQARKLKVVDREWETRASLELDIMACWGVPNATLEAKENE